MDYNLGWNFTFFGFVLIGWAMAFFLWIFSRVFRFMIEIFQSKNGQIRIEK